MRYIYAGASVIALMTAFASQAAAQAASEPEAIEEVIVTGTRTTGLRAVDSPAPIQVMGNDVLRKTGQPDLIQALAQNMPSVEAQTFGSDQAAFHLSFRLRGLNPNHTLVLLNGKRRHGTANIVPSGGSFGGNAAADVGIIPTASIDHVEVLQEGAAAQYGSDAIAGVVNIIQKKNASGGQVSVNGGRYMDGGGVTGNLTANIGIEPIEKSYLNVTLDTRYHGFSFRGDFDPRVYGTSSANALLAKFPDLKNAPYYPYVNRIPGDTEQRSTTVTYNGGYEITPDIDFYTFGSYTHRWGQAYENYRIPSAVTGVATWDIPFPYGFYPKESTEQDDYAITGGFSGTSSGWRWDLSTTYGKDTNKVYVLDSVNAKLYKDTSTLTTPGRSPREFHDGDFIASEWENTLDLSKEFDVGLASPLTLAFGGEYRENTYSIVAGQWEAYYGSGAESFFGYSPSDAGSYKRHNWAIYGDIAVNPIEPLKLDVAVRHEDYSDFGQTTVGKLTGRYDFNEMIAVRGTASTGFRAPTLGEEYYSGINVGPGSISGVLAPNSPGAKLMGFNGLGPEKSRNFSVGFVTHFAPRLTMTLDLYSIKIKDRITMSGTMYGYDARGNNITSTSVLQALAANGVTPNPDLFDVGLYPNATIGVASFVNGLDSKTQGADFVATYSTDFGDWGRVDWSLTGNYNFTRITDTAGPPANVAAGVKLFTDSAINGFKNSAPKWRATFGANWTWNKLNINARESFYGANAGLVQWPSRPYPSYATATGYVKMPMKAAFITDLDVSYQVTEWARFTVGANNLFNKYPTKKFEEYRTAQLLAGSTGYASPQDAGPFGRNGGYYYSKLTLTF